MRMYYKLVDKQVYELTAEERYKDNYAISERLWATELPGGIIVSTIFVSLAVKDQYGNPLVFETMVFGGEYDGYRKKYSSYEDAKTGHQKTTEMLFDV